MQIHICAVGRLRAGPEKSLIDDYLERFNKLGRQMALGPCRIVEVEDRKGGGMATEGELLARALPDGAFVCAMDERGKTPDSVAFAQQLGRIRDDGQRDMAFIIGGADGIDPALRARADMSLSFGKMVWPHMLVRVMLSEQLYRAASILAGNPYHRV